jgi:hypothetical protein
MSAPLERQYVMHVGKGAWGPTLAQRTPTPGPAALTVALTNMSYLRSAYLGVGLMFSRGGFLTQVSQTGRDEKTLWVVPLDRYKGVKHDAGHSYDDVLNRLAALPWDPAGLQFRLRWGETYTLAYEDAAEAGDGALVHVRAALWRGDGEDPEAPDSPPASGPHGGDPLNFYGARAGAGLLCDARRMLREYA